MEEKRKRHLEHQVGIIKKIIGVLIRCWLTCVNQDIDFNFAIYLVNIWFKAAVLAQVEENQRLKRLERERKIQEELEEERKLQQERDMLQNQYKEEQKKSRLKEVRFVWITNTCRCMR